MIRKLTTTTLGIIIAVSLSSAVSAQEGSHKKENNPKAAATTVTGEVVDLVCYIGAGDKGKIHSGCASACISSGLPVGILDGDGNVFLLVNKKQPLNVMLAPMASQQITVSGNESTRGGLRMLSDAKIEGVKAPVEMEGSHNKHEGSHKGHDGHKHEGSHKH